MSLTWFIFCIVYRSEWSLRWIKILLNSADSLVQTTDLWTQRTVTDINSTIIAYSPQTLYCCVLNACLWYCILCHMMYICCMCVHLLLSYIMKVIRIPSYFSLQISTAIRFGGTLRCAWLVTSKWCSIRLFLVYIYIYTSVLC